MVDTVASFEGPFQATAGSYLLQVLVSDVFPLCAPGVQKCEGGGVLECTETGDAWNPAIICAAGCSANGNGCTAVTEVGGNDSPYTAFDLSELNEGLTVATGTLDERTEGRDQDWFAFALGAPAVVEVATTSGADGSMLDTHLLFLDGDFAEIDSNDDIDGLGCVTDTSLCLSELSLSLPAGEYYVRVASSPAVVRTGDYGLEIEVTNQ